MLLLLLLCAADPPGPTRSTAEVVLSRGGELDGPPAATVTLEGDELVAYGFNEVPGRSRLQAALALADATARAELLAAVRAGVAEAQRDLQTGDQQEVERLTAQVASGVLPALSLPEHGWRKLQRGSEQVLQVWARLRASRAAVVAALEKALVRKDLAAAAAARIVALKGARK